MFAFLRRCCDGSQYKIVQRIEELFERFESAIGGIDLPKLIANINLIAQHLAKNSSAVPNLPATADTAPPIGENNSSQEIDTSVATTNDVQSPQEAPNLIDAFFSGKEQVIKDEIREFMLANYNISALDDQLEGKMYDYMVDAIWHLAIKKYIP